ncbi:MAG: restriction endonuclease subunit S [Nostoc sp. ChiSLP02]|nr:restriction endonuclease subunit S [Nostoc sp. DedSLP05]MDZ8102049.1 restriction endonuclease subunit S [Nostoc sp. DedSLP01]MDZ8189270.1 restriction endonuclease subunit S [Nostoc sp. ChiSLP02]
MGVKWWGEGAYERETIDGSQTAAKTLSIVREGDLIINKIWVRHGSIAIAGKDVDGCAASGEFPTFELDLNEVLPKWLHWYTKTREFWDKCAQLSQGTSGKNRIKPDLFLAVEIPLPPLEEQRRIVARIEELVGKIEEVRSLRQKAVEESNLIYKNLARQIFNNYIESSISIEKLIGRANLKNGKSIRATEQASGIKCIRLSAIRDGQIDCTDSKPVPMSHQEAQQYLVKPEDVFIVRGNGSKDLVGQAGIVKKFAERTIFPDLFIQVPLDSHKILPSFFVAWWNNPLMREKITEVAKTTSGIWKINQGHIASFSIPVPPLPEQHCIVTYLDELQTKVDKMKRFREQAIKELDALLPSILDKAFKGEL